MSALSAQLAPARSRWPPLCAGRAGAGRCQRQRLLRLRAGQRGPAGDRRHRPQRAARPDRAGLVRPRRLLCHRRLHGGDADDQASAGASGWPGRAAAALAGALGALLALPALRVQGAVPGDDHDRLRLHRRARHRRMARAHRRPERHHGRRRAGARRAASAASAPSRCSPSPPSARRSPPTPGWRAAPGAPRCARCAIRETAAESIGLDPVAIKAAAFAISALCAGAGGRPVRAARRASSRRRPSASSSRSCSCWW